MKRALVAIAALSLLGVSCSSSNKAATTPSVGNTVGNTAAAPAAITPAVLCTRGDGAVFFSYTNSAATPVALTAAQSVLSSARVDDNPYVPILFAAGKVSPAFYAFPGTDVSKTPTWSISGPDGTTHSAAVDAATPKCSDALLTPTTADPRTPSIKISNETLSADGKSVTITATVNGVPAASVCANGLTAEPVATSMDDGVGGSSVKGSTTTRTSPLFAAASGSGQIATFTVAALVSDNCSSNGVVQASWPGGVFEQMRTGLNVCVKVVDGVLSTESLYVDQCNGLPLTDGVRSRPS